MPGYAVFKNGVEFHRDTANGGLSGNHYAYKVIEVPADPPSIVDLAESCSVGSDGDVTVATVILSDELEIAPLDWSKCPGLTADHLTTGPTRIVFQGPGRDSQALGIVLKGETVFDFSSHPGVHSVHVSDLTLSYTSNPIPLLNVTGSSKEVTLNGVAIVVNPSQTELDQGMIQIGDGTSIHVVDSSVSAFEGSIMQPVVVAIGADNINLFSSSIDDMSVSPFRLTDPTTVDLEQTTINGCEAGTSQLCQTLPMFQIETAA
jgi:hypothetical protein